MQVGQVAQFGWDRPAQLVVKELQSFQVGQVAQFGWDRPAQLVIIEQQELQVGQVAQFGWDRPAQLVSQRNSSVTRPLALVVTPYH